jgi:hypothetical protein
VAIDDELDGYADEDDELDAAPRAVDPAAAARWAALKRRAGEGLDPLVRRILDDAARKAWGRGLFRRRYGVVSQLDEATWRAYRYLGSAADDEHHYLELGIVAHLDPDGNVIGFGVDNGVDFIGLHDVSEYGLRRGLEYIGQQRRQVRTRATPAYEHDRRPLKG